MPWGANHTARHTAERIELLSVIAAVVAYPATIGFVLLSLIGQHGGLLGFGLIWLLGGGVSIRVYAQFLRLWHGVGYSPAAMESATVAPPGTLTVQAAPPLALPMTFEVAGFRPPEERRLDLTNPEPSWAFEVTRLNGPDERRRAHTSPGRAGIDRAREEEEWREALREEWAKAEDELGKINPIKEVGKRDAA